MAAGFGSRRGASAVMRGRAVDEAFPDVGARGAGPLDAGPLGAGPLEPAPLDVGPLDAAPPDVDAGARQIGSGPSVRVRVGVGAAIVLVVVGLVCSVLITALSPVGVTTTFGSDGDQAGLPQSDGTTASPAAPTPSGRDAPSAGAPGGGAPAGVDDGTGAVLLVHVLGAVASPGVYELDEGSRVFDAVAAAGGLTEQADQASVNLARPLTDGEQLRVLAVGEAPPAAAGGAAGGGVSGAAGAAGAGGAGGASGGAGAAGAKVNLNAATELELDGLPRIGPAMAARIIAWRSDNGPFTSVEDLLQVTGIGDKTFEGLRDLVTV